VADPEAVCGSADFERRFFAGAEQVVVSIEVLVEMYDEMLAVIAQSGLQTEEGLRILLAQGLGYAKGQLLLQADDEARARMAARLAEVESMYAVMKRQTFCFMRDNQVLEMQNAAFKNANLGLSGVVQRLRSENEALTDEVRLLRGEVEAAREAKGERGETKAGGASAKRPKGIGRLLRSLGIHA
jgi:hypothetical protein